MAYEPLPIVDVAVDDLALDLDNYRIPSRRQDEGEALRYLFASEDVLGAALLILRDGYFDNEVPIVVGEAPNYVVLEGNRRVSALKALRDPALAPDHEAEIRVLLKRYAVEAANLPSVIRVLVAPDRTTAAPHIARLHTGLSKRRWSRDQQATFYYSLLDASTTVDDVKARYPGVSVTRFIKMAVVRRFLSGVSFSDASLHSYVISDELKMSSLEYAYRNKDIAEAVGIEFDRSGNMLPSNLTPEQIGASLAPAKRAALEYLMIEFRAENLNTRSKAFKKDGAPHDKLIEELVGFAPESSAAEEASESIVAEESTLEPPSPSSAPNSNERPATGSSESRETSTRPVPRGPNHPATRNKLDLSGIDYSQVPVNLKHRYHELRRINIDETPAAAVMLLRLILESTIKYHFEKKGTPVTGELTKIVPEVAKAYSGNKSLRDSINVLRSGTAQKPGSSQWFNLVSHSADVAIEVEQVRQAWLQINPLIRHLLRFDS